MDRHRTCKSIVEGNEVFERSLYLVSNTRRQIRTYMRTLIPFMAEMTSMQRSAASVNVVH